jgi:hypothetical protein
VAEIAESKAFAEGRPVEWFICDGRKDMIVMHMGMEHQRDKRRYKQ